MPQTIQTMPDGSVRVSGIADGNDYLHLASDSRLVWYGSPFSPTPGYSRSSHLAFQLKKRLADYLINEFGPEGTIGGFRCECDNLDAGPSETSPWLGFCEHGTLDGSASIIVASLYNSFLWGYSGPYYGYPLIKPFYCDISGEKKYIGNGQPIQWDSIWYYSGNPLRPQPGYSPMWNQGFGGYIAPGMDIGQAWDYELEKYIDRVNQQYGVYFDQSYFLLDDLMTSDFINPAGATSASRYKTALQCQMKDFFSDAAIENAGRPFYASSAPDTTLDPYAFFEITISYYGYGMSPEWIEFYPGASSGPSYFWQNKKNSIEFVGE